jgi:hypothetical protein
MRTPHLHPHRPLHPQRLASLLTILLSCFLLLAACGEETPPDPEVMTLRELLGLSPSRLAEMDAAAHAHFAQLIAESWQLQTQRALDAQLATATPPNGPNSPSLWLPDDASSPTLSLARVHDKQLAQQGEEALLSAALDAEPGGAFLTPSSLTFDRLGLSFDPDARSLRLSARADGEPMYTGELMFDPAWGAAEVTALGGISEREAAVALNPLLRRALLHLGADHPGTLIVPAARSPIALWYSPDEQALFINPNILYLLNTPAFNPDDSGLRTQQQALALPFIDDCVNTQRQRCNQCFGPAGNPDAAQCEPLFTSSGDPTEVATQECTSLSADAAFDLYCYHLSISQNLSCFRSLDAQQRCGAALVPFQSTSRLTLLSPMRSDEGCQQYLLTCEESRTGGTSGSTSGDTSGSTSGSTSGAVTPAPDPSLPSNPTPSPRSSDETSCSDDCTDAMCEVGLQALVTVACLGLVDGAEGCSSDDSESSSSSVPEGALLALPFALLAGAWWQDRRRPQPPSM